MKIEPTTPAHTESVEENQLDLDTTDNVVLNRLIDEIRDDANSQVGASARYDRTYNRHNR